jgi:hypothetical protein
MEKKIRWMKKGKKKAKTQMQALHKHGVIYFTSKGSP